MIDGPRLSTFQFGRYVLQRDERRLLLDGQSVALEPRAFDLLTVLIESAGRLIGKDELLRKVWPKRVVEEGNLHVHVSALRKALGHDVIATVAGRGYRFVPDVHGSRTRAESPAAHNLPHPLTSFVGREDDLAAVADALGKARLVTLTGIGGSGKTRLAIRLATDIADTFADGVRFVDLAAVTEPERVALTVAAVVGVREASDRRIEQALARHLAGVEKLLVLDNCEPMLDACAALVEQMLLAAPRLSVLVTSRERLGIAGESVVALRSLGFPDAESPADPDGLLEFDAVRLFVERATLAVPAFRLTLQNAAAVANVCRRLDGIPLALELAAARVKVLSVDQICAKLDDRFRLLVGDVRAVSRHQTLLATIESSFESLTHDEQRALGRWSVFAGGWTLPAAAAIDEAADDIRTLDLLGRLVDKSLVLVDRQGDGEPRYRLLETVREFAYERVQEDGVGAGIRDRHVGYFVEFAKRAQAGLLATDMRWWLDQLDAELPNLLAAHAWCDSARDGALQGLELATNLRSYWLARGLFAFGQRVYDEALGRAGVDPRAKLRGRALYALAQHHYVRGALRDALEPAQQALSIAREHGDDEWTVYCLDKLAISFAWLGEAEPARECCAEELAVARATGQPRLLGFALTAQGGVCRAQGDYRGAVDAYEQALALFDATHDLHNRHNTLVNLARVCVATGALDRANDTLASAIRLVGEMGTMYRGHFALEVASRLAAARGDWRAAALMQGASDAAVDKMGGMRAWFDDPILESLQARPAVELGADAHAAACAEGRAMSLEVALDHALRWIDA